MTHAGDPDYATIGGILLDPSQLDAVGEWLRPEDFAQPLCGEVYELITVMAACGKPIDAVTVLGELRRAGRLRDDGYPGGELVAMVEAVPVPASVPYYARLVLEAATFRRVEQCGVRITQVGRAHRGTPEDAFDSVAEAWRQVADARERWHTSAPDQDHSRAGLSQGVSRLTRDEPARRAR